MIKVHSDKGFPKTERFLKEMTKMDIRNILESYGRKGVDVLRDATPKDTGTTSASWVYEIVKEGNGYRIYWSNTNTNNGVPIALLLQYGHATRNGGFVQGIDYINPALRPIFEAMADEIWKEVSRK